MPEQNMLKSSNSLIKKTSVKILTVGLLFLGCFSILISVLTRQYLSVTEDQYLAHLKEMVEVARYSIVPILSDYRSGKISREKALTDSRNLLRLMTYEEINGRNYIFMSSYEGDFLVMPFMVEKEMTNQWDLKDQNGTYIIRELAAKAQKGGGYVSYYWLPPNSEEPQEKISYVVGVPELQTYIGTGRYMEEFRQAQKLFLLKMIGATFGLLILLVLLIGISLKQIKSSHERLEIVLDSFDSVVYVANVENHEVLFINKAGRDLFGDVVGKKCWKTLQKNQSGQCEFCTNDFLVDEKGNPTGVHVFEHKNLVNNEWYECRDRALIWDDGTLAKLEIATNITKRKLAEQEKMKLEAQFKQSQKMESIGMLAGGVAHEINNPIGIIMNLAELILQEAGEDVQVKMDAEEIIGECKRIANIVKNLLAFSRQEEDERTFTDIHEVIDSTLVLTNKILSKDEIKYSTDIAEDLPMIKCSGQQIKQVIMNLITNARDALNDRYPGYHENKRLKIYAGYLEGSNKEWVRLTIEDYGTGVQGNIQECVFDPFFTSKTRDKGTGLGLSVSYGIINEHKGNLSLESVENEFTRFHIDLPVDYKTLG